MPSLLYVSIDHSMHTISCNLWGLITREIADAAIGLKAQDVETNKVIDLSKRVSTDLAHVVRGTCLQGNPLCI